MLLHEYLLLEISIQMPFKLSLKLAINKTPSIF